MWTALKANTEGVFHHSPHPLPTTVESQACVNGHGLDSLVCIRLNAPISFFPLLILKELDSLKETRVCYGLVSLTTSTLGHCETHRVGLRGEGCAEAISPPSIGHTQHQVWGKRAQKTAHTLTLPSDTELALQVSVLMSIPLRDYPLPWSKEIHFSQRLINLQISLLKEVMLARISMHFF